MRVIAGKAKGRKLKNIPSERVRPITDRVKESLFNILGADIEGATLLDLFAGTGSVGIEALSRGADFVRFIDRDRQSFETIQTNLKLTGLGETAEVRRADAFTFLDSDPDRSFDYIYIAPPQYKSLWLQALQKVDARPGWLSEDAWVVVQMHPIEYQAVLLNQLEEFDRRRYGSTLLVFYLRKT